MLDREKIIEEADALTVANYLGMEIVRKGNYNFIACPGHLKRLGRTDDNISNCVLTPKGYHCFACGVKVGLIDMVMEYLECQYPEALSVIADSCGGKDLYSLNGKAASIKKQLSLSQEDLEIIGLLANCSFSKTVNIADDYNDTEENSIIKKQFSELLVYEKIDDASLLSLMLNDEDSYNALIVRKAEEAIDNYQEALKKYEDRDAYGAVELFELFSENNSLDSNVFFGVKNAIQKKLNRAEEILTQQKEKMATKK